jgi:allophanate hydrolase subunit 1
MIQLFKDHQREVEICCAENNLSAGEIFCSACSYNREQAFLQHVDHAKGAKGLLDETPAEVTLMVFLENGKLRFQQTEHTYRLYEREPVAKAATA